MSGYKFTVQGTGTNSGYYFTRTEGLKENGNENKLPRCYGEIPEFYSDVLSFVLKHRTEKEIKDVVDLLDNNEKLNDFFDSLYGRYIYSKESNIKNDKKMILMNYYRGVLSKDDILELINNEIPFNFLFYYLSISVSSEFVSKEDLAFLKELKKMGVNGHSQYLCFHRYKRKKLTLSNCRKIRQEHPDEKDFEDYMQEESNFN